MLKPVMMSDKVLYMKYNGLLKPVMFYKEEGGQYIDTIYDAQGNPVNPRTLVSVGENKFSDAYEYNTNVSGNLKFDKLEEVNGDYAFYESFDGCSLIESVSFPKLKTIKGESAFANAFLDILDLKSAEFPVLESIDAWTCFTNTFTGCNLKEVSFEKLKSISGQEAMIYVFAGCPELKKVYFNSLESIDSEWCFHGAFYDDSNLTDIYFNSLKTTTFAEYKNQIDMIMYGTGDSIIHTIHFPSNLEDTIQTLDGYPLFGGEIGYVVLAFDLPATE